jgi:hypothetical protein
MENKCCIDNYSDSSSDVTWVQVVNRKRKAKIYEPCWFFNNGGCRHKDGTDKDEKDCKYLHVFSTNVKRPRHLNSPRPCHKYDLEGLWRWKEQCKYSHRTLTEEEWCEFYPEVPNYLRILIQRRQFLESKLEELESRLVITEYKLTEMDNYYEEKIIKLEQYIQEKYL